LPLDFAPLDFAPFDKLRTGETSETGRNDNLEGLLLTGHPWGIGKV